MKRRGRVFRVRSKPSKQPLGLVARGVPIEKVRAKRAMHSDWARGVAGAWRSKMKNILSVGDMAALVTRLLFVYFATK